VIGPATENPCHTSPCGDSDTRPRCGFNPYSPVAAAGSRIEPPPSLPRAAAASPAATAAAAPPLEPAGECANDHGLRVAPANSVSVNGHRHSSGALVRPTITAPAARSRRTISASAFATRVTASVP
jgi:hypothetical protein